MNNTVLVKSLLILSTMVLLGFTAPASADWGMGSGHHYGWGNHMSGWPHGGYEGPGFGYRGNLSEEDIQKLEKERFEFFKATQDLKSKIYQKNLELRSELAKENPDNKIAAGLQKEISKFKAEFDQKRLNHFLKMRKISPDIGRGFGGGYGMMGSWGRGGYGMMSRGMMDGGGPGGYGMTMGPGWGMGPGMMGSSGYGGGRSYRMGPGMMGPGYEMGRGMMGPGLRGRGMGPARREPDYWQQPLQERRQLEEKDARSIVENYIRSTRNPNLELGKIKDAGNVFEAEIVTKDKSIVDKVLVDKNTGWMRSAY